MYGPGTTRVGICTALITANIQKTLSVRGILLIYEPTNSKVHQPPVVGFFSNAISRPNACIYVSQGDFRLMSFTAGRCGTPLIPNDQFRSLRRNGVRSSDLIVCVSK